MYNRNSSTTVDHPDSVAYIDNSFMENLIIALDTVEQLIKLLCCQCPDASAFFLESVIQQSRLFPSNFILSPFIVSCLNGLQFILSENEPVISWGNKTLPLIALELNGAEGRNFEAVITRLKQMYIQHRHIENTNVKTGNDAPAGISVTSKLPASMTTLCLSTRINLPQEMRNYLNIGTFPFSLVIKIPLVKSSPVKKLSDQPPLIEDECHSFISQRRLGRLSMGNTSDLLSFSVFDPESKSCFEKKEQTSQSIEAKSDMNVEWTSWDRVWELLNNSLGEEAIETAIGSNFSPTMLLGLSVNDILQSTNSAACVKQMMQQINKEQVNPDKAHSETLYKILRRYKQLNIENIGEFIEILLMGVYTSNHLLHASVSKTLSILIETNGPPIFDLILQTAHSIAKNLYKHLLLDVKDNKATSVSRLLVLSRLLILIDSTLNFLTDPSIEASLCFLKIASAGLQTLQNVPMLDDSWSKIPIFICIFDCLLPLFSRLLSSGIKILSFDYFAFTSTSNITNNTPSSHNQNRINDQENDKFMRSLKYSNQFKIFLQKQSVFQDENPSLIQASRSSNKISSDPSYASNISQGYQKSLRTCCTGLSTIINQLPIAYDTYKRETILTDQLATSHADWSGLSLSVVIQILTLFEEISRHPILRLLSFYKFQEDFLQIAFTYTKSHDTLISNPQFITGEPEATIQLNGIFSSVFEFFTHILPDVENNLENVNFEKVLEVASYLVKICSTLINDSNLYSVQLLLSLGFSNLSADAAPDQSSLIHEKSTTVQDLNNTSQIQTEIILEESSTKGVLLYTLLTFLTLLNRHCSNINSSIIEKNKSIVHRINALIQQINDIETYVSNNSATNLLPTKLDLSDLFSSTRCHEHNLDANMFFFDPGVVSLLHTFSREEKFTTKHCTTSSRAILNLAIYLKSDSLWRMSSVLEKLTAPFANDSTEPSDEVLSDDPPLKCLSHVVWSQIANNVLTNEAGPTSFLRDTLSLAITKNQTTTSRVNTVTPVLNETVATDTFRARRGPSSRAPSKHVDEFQAQQLKNDTVYKGKQNLATSDSSLEGSLDVIPEWREFVLSGKERGLDVMGILKSPQVLQDPCLESRFRSLVELHPSIKTLFSMMEIDTGLS
ncbi:uncharacterized protein LOC128882887 isoform X2 [Hylaeus volcanicus]|uniref:uncharacterized protein LOC128882887 isoform X2 n=1 Tax=Hylaeus volcanicus TaxID=313075 RepID=UPI0023B7B463|nr:uncharacterized protein LOC128882887 isoform X2 [Hylaeus volcanicus]